MAEWLNELTKETFKEKKKCMIDQYSSYEEPNVELNVNGFNTQGENIADNGGLKEAYYAYQRMVKKHGVEAKLPGLEFTQNQLFWIAAGQTWCSSYSESLYSHN